MAPLRLFAAFDTPPPVKELAVQAIERLRSAEADVSWERAGKFHCTLKFLGSVEPGSVESISTSLRASAGRFPPFSVRYAGFGSFPNRHAPRILWLGIHNDDGILPDLHRGLETALEVLGFLREERAFHPHLTLGRVRSPRKTLKLIEILESLTLSSGVYPVREVKLMKSEPGPTGSHYTEMESYPLLGNRRGGGVIPVA